MTPVSGDLIPSSSFLGHQAYTLYTYICQYLYTIHAYIGTTGIHSTLLKSPKDFSLGTVCTTSPITSLLLQRLPYVFYKVWQDPWLLSTHANSTSPVVRTKNISRHCQIPLRENVAASWEPVSSWPSSHSEAYQLAHSVPCICRT